MSEVRISEDLLYIFSECKTFHKASDLCTEVYNQKVFSKQVYIRLEC